MSDWEIVEDSQTPSEWEVVSSKSPTDDKEALRQKLMDLTTDGIFSRPANRLTQDAISMAKDVGRSVTEGVPALFKQAAYDPLRMNRNIFAGAVGVLGNGANALLNLPAYLADLESNKASDFLKKYTPQIPVEKIQEKIVGGETSEDDAGIRHLVGNLPILFPLGKAAGKGVARVGSRAMGKTDPLLETNEIKLQLLKRNKKSYLEQKEIELEAADDAYKEAIAQAKQDLGKADPDLMKYNVTKRQQEIQNLNEQMTGLKDQLANIKPEENALSSAEENLNTAQSHHENAQQLAQEIDDNIAQFLNKDAAHDVRFSQTVKHRIDSIENYANESYKNFLKNIADANFQMPKEALEKLDYDNISQSELFKIISGTHGADAFEALRKGKGGLEKFIKKQEAKETKQGDITNPYLQRLMEVAPTVTDTKAADFLAKYKDFRDRTFKLNRQWKDPRVEEVEKQKMGKALDEARKMQAKMKEVLDKGLGEYKPEFERLNKLYSEQVYPLRANPIVEKAEEGRNSSNIIHDLRTNEEGMPLVRELVKQDPELLRNVIGQRYFAKADEVHNPNEIMREYLNEVPELKKLLKERHHANKTLQQAKGNIETAKKHHAEMVAREEDSAKIQKKIDDMTADINKYSTEIAHMQKHLDNLTMKANNKKISLKEKIKTQREIKSINRQLEETTKKLDEKVTGLRKHIRTAKKIYQVGKQLKRLVI